MARESKKSERPNDAELWNQVKSTATPLRKKTEASNNWASSSEPKIKIPENRSQSTVIPSLNQAVAKVPDAPNPLDNKTVRKIAKGKLDIDARLDLHGRTQAEAHNQLLAFLQAASERNHRVVLVITGKGRLTGGVLRSAVPLWFEETRFRKLVSGYRESHTSHGGSGALYVKLRRQQNIR